ncbi:MAG: hypothetical protein JNL35_07695 [Sphingopyxis sp.]|nr:hypothetical protein [Sphingopyxis sp.]
MTAFRKALAEGTSVEEERLNRLCSIWSLDLSALTVAQHSKLAMRIEVKAHDLAGISAAADLAAVAQLGAAKKKKLCLDLSAFVASELGVEAAPADLVGAFVAEAVDSLIFREALIYRDWQDALGDAMIKPDEDSIRRFRIIGFADFEKLIEERETPWLEVFAASIDDIDLENADPRDFRSHQLRRLARAAAAILVAASREPDTPVGPDVLATANRLIASLSTEEAAS